MNGATTKWTDERVQILRDRWDAGDSASVIAKATGMSRSAVLGKAWRMGLPERGSPLGPARAAPTTQEAKEIVAKAFSTPPAAGVPVVARRPNGDPDDSFPLRGCQYLAGQVGPTTTIKIKRVGNDARQVKSETPGTRERWADVPKCGKPRLPDCAWCDDHYRICFSSSGPLAESEAAVGAPT